MKNGKLFKCFMLIDSNLRSQINNSTVNVMDKEEFLSIVMEMVND